MMINHTPGPEILAYLHGELETAQAERVRAHAADCPACAAEMDTMRALLTRLDDDAAYRENPHPVWPSVRAGAGPKAGPLFAVGTVAACLLGLLIGLWAGQEGPLADTTLQASGASSLDYLWSADDSGSFLRDRTYSTGRTSP